MRAAIAATFLSLAAPIAASELVLGLPLDCEPGADCYIQRYVDRDPGQGVRDYRCGTLAGNGHKGTDFALHTVKDMEAGVTVRASAAGRVKAVRDSMPDRIFTSKDSDELAGRECGNGVVITHGDGWETQYCHLKQGSLVVTEGDYVERGDALGQVGLSGLTNFPHVHLSVRKDGAEIDPFHPAQADTCGEPTRSLWDDPPAYSAGGLIYAGFADRVPSYEEVTDGTVSAANISVRSSGLVLYALGYGVHAGDVMHLIIDGPAGMLVDTEMEIDAAKPRLFRAAGRRLVHPAWPAGRYEGTVALIRGGTRLDQLEVRIDIP